MLVVVGALEYIGHTRAQPLGHDKQELPAFKSPSSLCRRTFEPVSHQPTTMA